MSEITRLKQQIDAEVEAMREATTGYAAVAKHHIINYRLANLGTCFEQLSGEIGSQRAIEMVIDALETGPDPLKQLGGEK